MSVLPVVDSCRLMAAPSLLDNTLSPRYVDPLLYLQYAGIPSITSNHLGGLDFWVII